VTLRSLAFNIFSRLYTRFSLEPQPVEQTVHPAVGTQITPVTNVDELLLVPTALTGTEDLQAGAGDFVTYFTVTTGRRWRLRHVQREATSSITRIAIIVNGTTHNLTTLQTGQDNEYTPDVILDQGDTIGMLTTGNAGDSSRTLHILFDEENAF